MKRGTKWRRVVDLRAESNRRLAAAFRRELAKKNCPCRVHWHGRGREAFYRIYVAPSNLCMAETIYRALREQFEPRPISCRWCGANPAQDSTVALTRVNEKGVPGIWECVPYCRPPQKVTTVQ